MSTPKKRHPWQGPWKPGKKPSRRKPPQKVKRPRPIETRRVMVILELETGALLEALRSRMMWELRLDSRTKVIQAQANVIHK